VTTPGSPNELALRTRKVPFFKPYGFLSGIITAVTMDVAVKISPRIENFLITVFFMQRGLKGLRLIIVVYRTIINLPFYLRIRLIDPAGHYKKGSYSVLQTKNDCENPYRG
jgi:hypothetical protein